MNDKNKMAQCLFLVSTCIYHYKINHAEQKCQILYYVNPTFLLPHTVLKICKAYFETTTYKEIIKVGHFSK